MAQLVKPQLPRFINFNRIIIVGEAPGREEAQQGIPFVGEAGILLNQLLESADIDRAKCAIINPFMLRPPGNNVGYFFVGSYRELRPEFAEHLKVFRRNMRRYAPAIIMALGKTANWALTGYTGSVTERFGKMSLTDFGLVIHGVHPAYILRLDDPGEITKQQIALFNLARILARRLV